MFTFAARTTKEMADNFLEKKLEEYKSGKTVIRRSTPSLESLMKRLAGAAPEESGYVVKQAQLDAMARTAKIVCPDCSILAEESGASISISSADPVILGEAVLAARLKAAELGLNSKVSLSEGSALIKVFK